MMSTGKLRTHSTAAAALVGISLLALAATADDFDERVAAESGGTLRVHLDRGSLEIESHDHEEVRVEASASGRSEGMRFELRGDGRVVELSGKRRFPGWLSGSDVRVRIRVPEEFSLDVHTSGGEVEVEGLEGRVRMQTSGGRVEVSGIIGETDVRTSGGEVEVSEVEGPVRARTSGGDVRISEVEGAVDAETSGGKVEVKDVSGPVRLRSSGGPISVRFTEPPEGDIRTSGGGIEVEFPEGEGLDLDAETSGGGVEIDPPLALEGRIDRSQVRGKVNGGGARLLVRTSGGTIEIRER